MDLNLGTLSLDPWSLHINTFIKLVVPKLFFLLHLSGILSLEQAHLLFQNLTIHEIMV